MKRKNNYDSLSLTSSKKNVCTSSVLIEKITKSKLKDLEICDTEVDTCITKAKKKINNGMVNEVNHLLNVMTRNENKVKNTKKEKNKNLKFIEFSKENTLQTQYKRKVDLPLEKKKNTMNQNGKTESFGESTYYMVKKLTKQSKKQKKNNINKISVSTKECMTYFNNTSDNSSVQDTNKKYYVTCSICHQWFLNTYIYRHMQTHIDDLHKCDKCCKSFKKKADLLKHQIVHATERAYKCNLCEKTYKYISGLTVHRRSHHNEYIVKCSYCTKEFSQASDLSRHIRIHTGERPFECNICDSAFTLKSSLSVHKRVHTGERPYSCSECGLAFNQSHVLIEHKRKHTGEKPYKCSICNWAFASHGDLNKHFKRKHYKCY